MIKRIKTYFLNIKAFKASKRAIRLRQRDGLRRWVLHIDNGFIPVTRKRMKEMAQNKEVSVSFQELKKRAIFITN